jgi:hypothetical protein
MNNKSYGFAVTCPQVFQPIVLPRDFPARTFYVFLMSQVTESNFEHFSLK